MGRIEGTNIYNLLASPGRCPRGSRRDRKTGECVRNSDRMINKFPQMRLAVRRTGRKKRCPNGSRRNKKTHKCVDNSWRELPGR